MWKLESIWDRTEMPGQIEGKHSPRREWSDLGTESQWGKKRVALAVFHFLINLCPKSLIFFLRKESCISSSLIILSGRSFLCSGYICALFPRKGHWDGWIKLTSSYRGGNPGVSWRGAQAASSAVSSLWPYSALKTRLTLISDSLNSSGSIKRR